MTKNKLIFTIKEKKKELATTWAIRARHSGWAIRAWATACQYNKISRCTALQAQRDSLSKVRVRISETQRQDRAHLRFSFSTEYLCPAPAMGALPLPTPPPRPPANLCSCSAKWTLNGALASPLGEPRLRPFGFWSREPGFRLVPGLWRLTLPWSPQLP